MTATLSREDEIALAKGGCTREQFIAMRERELSEKGAALAEFRKDADGLTLGDKAAMKVAGVSREAFLKARAAEIAAKEAR